MTDVVFVDTWRKAWNRVAPYLPEGHDWEGSVAKVEGYRVFRLPSGFAVVERHMVRRHYDSRGELETGGSARARNYIDLPLERTALHVIVESSAPRRSRR